MRWGLRVGTDPRFGSGHLARCGALAQLLSTDVTLFCDPSDKSSFPWAKTIVAETSAKSAAHAVAALRERRVEALLFDGYSVDERHISEGAAAGFVAAFRDGPPYGAERLTIDPNPGPAAAENVLKGPSFMPLPPVYAERRREGRMQRASKKGGPILVAFGGRDSTNRTILALDALDNGWGADVVVALGRAALHREAVAEKVSRMAVARLHENGDLLPIYAKAALAIGAPGVSQFERACCGIPTALVAQNARQKPLVAAWAETGAAVACDPDVIAIRNAVNHILSDKAQWNTMNEKSLALVDGNGASRLADVLNRKAAA